MADQDNEQIQDQQPNQPSQEPAVDEDALYKDIGQHVAKKYQEFLDNRSQGDIAKAKEEYEQSQSPQSGLAALANLGGNLPQQPAPVPQTAPIQQPMVQQTVPQPLTQSQDQGQPQPMSPEAPALAAETNLENTAQNVSKNIQKSYEDTLANQQDFIRDMQARHENNMLQDKMMADAYRANKIQPMQIFRGNTGQKLLTGLGLIFSGIGSGITGQPNMAMQMINQTIQRDMDAQKLNSENEYNTWRMHREMTNDEYSADLAFQRDALVALHSQIEAQQAKLMGPQAQAAAEQAKLGIRGQLIDLSQKQAMWQATQDALSGAQQPSSGIINNNKWNALKMTGILKGEDETAATKEATNYSEAESLRKDMEQSAQHLDKQLLAGALHPSDRQSAINAFAGRIAKVGEGRFNLEEAKLQAQALLPSPLDSRSTVQNKAQRRQAFFDSLAQTPTLDRFGLKNQSQGLQQSQMKTMNGRQYTKVPGGWQLVR